ncbi:hypothetical protein NQZ68_002610 [Dissostichus eleginoides]|nr:hypothetical protein NQZ68_002610 [Dissostichus eleginoides]
MPPLLRFAMSSCEDMAGSWVPDENDPAGYAIEGVEEKFDRRANERIRFGWKMGDATKLAFAVGVEGG